MLHGKREAMQLPFFRGASPITALRAAQPPAAGPLLRLLRNLADAHPGRWCGIWKSHGFPFSVEHLLLQRYAMLSLRLPARCFDCSAISLTLPGPLMRRLEVAWLLPLRWICNPPLTSEIHLRHGTAPQVVLWHTLRAGTTIFLTPRHAAVVPDTCRTHQARR